jgi:ferritin-like protein
MTEPLTLELVDPEAAAKLDGHDPGGVTRFGLLRRAAVAGGAVLGSGLLLTNVPKAFAQAVTDVDILNVLNLNETLEAAFYAEAANRGALSGEALTFARQLAANEAVHRDTVRAALGSNAAPLPAFAFGDTTASEAAFVRTALVLEANDVAANNGAGPKITSKALLAAAGQIVSVEGRQAAWIRRIAYGPKYANSRQYPAPQAFDKPITLAQAQRRLQATGFIQGA